MLDHEIGELLAVYASIAVDIHLSDHLLGLLNVDDLFKSSHSNYELISRHFSIIVDVKLLKQYVYFSLHVLD